MVVQQTIFEKNLLTKLEVTDTIINALDESVKKEINAIQFQKELHQMFNDNTFMRKIAHISAIMDNVELAVEYLGKDYLSTRDYNYDIKFEKKIVIVKKKLHKFLGSLLKELDKGEQIEL